MDAKRHVFIFGLDEFHRHELATIAGGEHIAFHPLLEHDEAIHPERFPVDAMLARSEAILDEFPARVDAVCTYWDFPTSTLVPLIRAHRGLPGAGLEAVLKLEHKFWARVEQQEVVPELIPPFAAIDPFAPDPTAGLNLDYPFWLKPVKAHSSYLGFRINNRNDFKRAIAAIRQGIEQFAKPFNEILARAELPEAVAQVDGYHCIAEGLISHGMQCTLEGYAHQGEVKVYGIVDSVRGGPHRSSFTRYQYPSVLPQIVQRRMMAAAKQVIDHAGYTEAPFNIEFFWDKKRDVITLLEANARCSKSHSALFYRVDGASNLQVMVRLGLGETPDFPHRQGDSRVAAKFMLRVYRPGQVTRVPSAVDIERLYARFPKARLRVLVHEGQDLGTLRFQDSYSFELAELFMGAASQAELLSDYRQALEILNFQISEPSSSSGRAAFQKRKKPWVADGQSAVSQARGTG